MATISCGHCGSTHSSVAEVRACSTGNTVARAGAPEAAGTAVALIEQSESVRPSVSLGLSANDLAGDRRLGRSVLLNADDPVPAAWREAPEIPAHAQAESKIIERLLSAWRDREAVVIRWSGPMPIVDDTDQRPFHQLSPADDLPGEALLFAITANTIDARGGSVGFAPLQQAIELGASVLADPGPDDAELGDGRSVVVDGGPLDLNLAKELDRPVVPRVHLVAGSLRPLERRDPPSASLAPDQLAAVAHQSGPARILAPAGSGKTRVLTERARHLVADCGLTARSICLVAYNRRAKDEMHQRLLDVPALEIRTLNSLALAIASGSGPFATDRSLDRRRTIDEFEARRMLDRLVPGRRRRALSDPLEPWIDALSACRLGLRDPAEIEDSYNGDVAGFPDVLAAYRAELAERNLLDFDEQILTAIDRLRHEPNLRARARSVAPVVLVDEFQDLTPAHLLLLRLLCGPAAEIFAVGDDDQTIYSYAGASPDWLIDFDRFFPGSSAHHLTVNYRCPAPVVAAAVRLLSHNRRRVPKQIEPATVGDEPSPETEDGLVVHTGSNPHHALRARVNELLDAGATPSEIAVLTRVNAALLPPALHLHQDGVPVVRPPGLDGSMIERSGVGSALAWMGLATAPEQRLAPEHLRAALRRPPRSLHPRITDWACEQRSVTDLRRLAGRLNTERDADNVAQFAEDIASLRRMAEAGGSTEELLSAIYDTIGLLGAASQLDTSQRSARRAAHADELSALVAVAGLCPDPSQFETWLRQSIEELPRLDIERPQDGVVLATVHTTKGLEWPHVIVHDVRDDLFPHRLATDTEEERRIFHVAITRGRQSVTVIASGPPSPFVSELAEARPADLPWPKPEDAQHDGRSGVISSRSAPRSKQPSGGSVRQEPATPAESSRRDALTAWRKQRAQDDGVPAYVVLDNKTLDAIAKDQPGSLGELGAIKGIGPAKLERYGADMLGILASIEG